MLLTALSGEQWGGGALTRPQSCWKLDRGFCHFQHFYGTYTTCGDLTLNKQAYLESNTVVSCINAMICLLTHQCEICLLACIQQLLHYSETGGFRLPAIFAKLNRCYFCVVVALCCILCLEFDSGCI